MSALTGLSDSAPPKQAVAVDEHIIDVLIRERAPRLSRSPVWPLARPILYGLLAYRGARAMADAVAPMGGVQAMDYASALLQLQVAATGLEHVPRAGGLIVIVNHPTGLADAVAIYDALKGVRPDLVFFANSDAHRVSPGLQEVFIPVEWVEAKRTRERTRLTLRLSQQALAAGRAIVIFPAGRIARVRGGVLVDPPWAASAISLARRHKVPIAPIHLSGPPSWLFRLLDHISPELRDITLFHELLNKRGGAFRLTVGPPIPPAGIGDPAETTLRLKRYVERQLPLHPDQPFA